MAQLTPKGLVGRNVAGVTGDSGVSGSHGFVGWEPVATVAADNGNALDAGIDPAGGPMRCAGTPQRQYVNQAGN